MVWFMLKPIDESPTFHCVYHTNVCMLTGRARRPSWREVENTSTLGNGNSKMYPTFPLPIFFGIIPQKNTVAEVKWVSGMCIGAGESSW